MNAEGSEPVAVTALKVGEAEIKQQLTWQTITLEYSEDGPIRLNSLRIYIEDKDRNGEIYIDSINFI